MKFLLKTISQSCYVLILLFAFSAQASSDVNTNVDVVATSVVTTEAEIEAETALIIETQNSSNPIGSGSSVSDPMNSKYLTQLVLGLLVVIVCIFVLAWLAKRVNGLQANNGSLLKIVGGVSMGSREKIVLLQVGDEQLLIGVAPGRINTLHVLDTPLSSDNLQGNSVISKNISEKIKNIVTEGA